MASSATDPNGWVTNPPQTIVKIANTSRDALNGQLGVVLQYLQDKGRYVVHLTVTQEQVSLKPDNLTKASWMEQAQGQYQLLRHDVRLQRQATQFIQQVESRIGFKIQYLGMALLVALIASFYFLGFNKTLMSLTMLMLFGILVGPDLAAGATWNVVMANLPTRTRALIREHLPFGATLASNTYMTYAVVGLVLALYAATMLSPMGAGSRRLPPPPPNSFAATASTGFSGTALREQQEQFYKLGFEDAKNGFDFGTSLPEVAAAETTAAATASAASEFESEFDHVPLGASSSNAMPPPSDGSSGGGIWKHIGTFGSLFYVANTVNELGRDAVTGQFSVSAIQSNITQMETWRMAMLGFVVYRLVRQLIF